MVAMAMPKPELQYDTAKYDSPAIYDMLYDTYDGLCCVATYNFGLVNEDSTTVGSLLNRCILYLRVNYEYTGGISR
ncbi:hypothetical protein TSAR_015618 [Trichomalopsis sarcophagae]|uniref:Uncharacterized protein n=1 Tax=Trichomalopsis sarcophagae TaxID=543379 RepID=A0A232EFT9_9HYME|nr:hypothetical protein TSAR_015618 [Trichomalopsis sarcophagae]